MIKLEQDYLQKLAIDKAKYSSEYLEGIVNDVKMMQSFATEIFANGESSSFNSNHVRVHLSLIYATLVFPLGSFRFGSSRILSQSK